MMLKNGQTHFKNLVVFTPQYFKKMFDHFFNVIYERVNCEIKGLCQFHGEIKVSNVMKGKIAMDLIDMLVAYHLRWCSNFQGLGWLQQYVEFFC